MQYEGTERKQICVAFRMALTHKCEKKDVGSNFLCILKHQREEGDILPVKPDTFKYQLALMELPDNYELSEGALHKCKDFIMILKPKLSKLIYADIRK
jgi:hypothetical protein